MIRMSAVLVAVAMSAAGSVAHAEDGYDLWLRYRALPGPLAAAAHPSAITAIGASPTLRVATEELQRGFSGLSGTAVPLRTDAMAGGILIATARTPMVMGLHLATADLGDDGYRIRSVLFGNRRVVLITANTDRGALYGAFALLRWVQTGHALAAVDLASTPKLKLRVLDHWDNLDGSVERGYAGRSLWDWWTLPDFRDPRYVDYARANASVGINGTVLNNVNAKADSLTAPYIAKAAVLAGVFRPYGIKVYLSARFSAPIEIGGLKSADPKDPAVAAWWRAKADEIYRAIPDFGGFLVKANSEGQPGPQDYHRTHADGANMLAAALAPHGGIVMWRAFVYAADNAEDRAKQAYDDFKPLDGTFASNVLVQVKNGAIDFQPREPFHPLFGAMPHTALMPEFQITKEYLGQATHLAYLGPLFEETLRSDTRAHGPGSTVAEVIDGTLDHAALTGMAGVANIGNDRDWSGSTFNQANWFAFGRFAWDPAISSDRVAQDWAAMTFGPVAAIVEPVTRMMAGSREAVVDYMTPLGLAHLMATGSHYGPAPWVADLKRPEWNPRYYHRADADGIGVERGPRGTDATGQYAPSLAKQLADPATTPETELLWFHRLPWSYRLRSGDTLWQGMIAKYDAGVAYTVRMRQIWAGLAPLIDHDRYAKTAVFLTIQQREAEWWRDASIAYWRSVNALPLPPGVKPPAHDLAWYEAQRSPYAPGNP